MCSERGITRLVYTSTVNVAFAGKPIEDGDEDSVALLPLEMVNERAQDCLPFSLVTCTFTNIVLFRSFIFFVEFSIRKSLDIHIT